MNFSKLKDKFNSSDTSAMENFIQSARVNEELAKMNEEVTVDFFKKFLNEIFENHKNFKLFNSKKELDKKQTLIIPHDDMMNIWNKDAYTYYLPKKNGYFLMLPASEEAKGMYNLDFFIVKNGATEFHERISFANQLTEIQDKIEFYIQSMEFLDEDTKNVKFEDLTLDDLWFEYSNLRLLTDACIKGDNCKKKKCNKDSCKKYFQMVDYTTNIYKCNEFWNKIIENICKFSNMQVYIDYGLDKTPQNIKYTIGNLIIELFFPSRKDDKISSVEIKAYKNLVFDKLIFEKKNIKSDNGKEFYVAIEEFSEFVNSNKDLFKEIIK